MTIQAKYGTIATIVVNQTTPAPVANWDKSYNRVVYNPYGFNIQPSGTLAATTSYLNYSTYFAGTGSFVTVTGTPISTSTVNFTVESWMYLSSPPPSGGSYIAGDMSPSTSTIGWAFGVTNSSTFTFVWNDGVSRSFNTRTAKASIKTWYHLAVVVNAGTISLFVNGQLQASTGTSVLTTPRTQTLNGLTIGQYNNGNNSFVGYISNLRISSIAQYPASFAAPTGPSGSIAGTQLLTLQNNYFIDNGPNRYPITGISYPPSGSSAYFSGAQALGGNSIYYTPTGLFTGTSVVHIFTSTATINYFTATSTITNAAYLIVGGGGGGGSASTSNQRGGGGGGAGGMITGTFTATAGTTYAIQVGTGGVGTFQAPTPGTASFLYSADGGGSAYFTGTNYLVLSTGSNYATANAFQSNVFTIEGWHYFQGFTQTTQLIYSNYGPSGFVANCVLYGKHSSYNGQMTFWVGNYSTTVPLLVDPTTSTTNLNTWTHYAVVRNVNTWTIYRNGISVTATNWIGAVTTSSTAKDGYEYIGASYVGTQGVNGYISNLRFVIGAYSVYTSNFTPPTGPLTSVAQTTLLVFQTGTSITDVSPTGFTFNNINGVLPTFISPFSTTKLSAGGGGAGGAYYTTPTSALFSGQAGGSGGGGSGGGNVGSTPVAGGAGIPGQGFAGGIGVYGCGTNYNAGGGGGGAGSTGTNATCYLRAGPGGIGRQSSIAGTPTYYAGGGGGGSGFSGGSSFRGLGGLGGGGAGTWYNNNTGCISQCGQPGTGGGGGGSGGYPSANYSGGQGGSGVVVISYPICSSANYLSIPSTTSNNLSNNNFTIEMWVNTLVPTRYSTLYAKEQGTFGTGQWQLMINSAGNNSGDVAFWAFDAPTGGTAPLLITAGAVINNNEWHHIALVRNGNTWSIYVDGGVKATASWAGTIANLTTSTVIGTDIVNTGRAFVGYITNLRMVNGTAVYTQNFTPSINPLTPVANTALLTLQNLNIADNSGNNSIVTNIGPGITTTATITPFSSNGLLNIVNTFTPFAVTTPQQGRLIEQAGYGIAQVVVASSATNRKRITYFDSLPGPGTLPFTVSTPNINNRPKIPAPNWDKSYNRVTYDNYGFAVNTVNSLQPVFTYTNFSTYFNGTASSVTVLGNPLSPVTTMFTVESWIYPTNTTGTTSYIVGDYNSTATAITGWAYGLNSSNNFEFTWSTLSSSTSASAYFNGTSAMVSVPTTSTFNLGSNDFTIECWFYLTALGLTQTIYNPQSSLTSGIWLGINSSNNLVVYLGTSLNSWDILNSSIVGSVTTNRWYHVAAVKNKNTFAVYLNGNAGTFITTTATVYFPNQPVNIGNSPSNGYWFNGYISNFRIVNGTAVYGSSFTPPTTPLTTVTNTVLLTLQSTGTIFDASTVSNGLYVPGPVPAYNLPVSAYFSPFTAGVTTASYRTTAVASTNTWYHFAVSVIDNSISLYVNGVRQTSTTGTSVITGRTSTTNSLIIGGTNFRGYVSNLRVINNNPIYNSSTFVIPSAALGNTIGTQLLTLQNNIFADNGPNRYLLYPSISLSNGYITNFTGAQARGGDRVYTTPTGLFTGTSVVHIFTSTATINYFTATSTITNAAYLIVGGGGGGGSSSASNQRGGGGGGAGGMITGTFTATAGTTYAIQVGTGGVGTLQAPTPGIASFLYSADGGGSAYFTGTAQLAFGASAANTNSNALQSQSFTIEGWHYFQGFTQTTQLIYSNYAGVFGMVANSIYYGKHSSYSGQMTFWVGNNSLATPLLIDPTPSISNLSTWTHYAVVRWVNTFTMYRNGISVISASYAGAVTTATTAVAGSEYIGGNSTGYISNFRIVKGTAVYTAPFTPPTNLLTTVTNTTLLVFQTSTSITDISTSGFTFTNFGGVLPTFISPFSTTKLSAGGGGAGGAYYTTPTSALFSGQAGGSGGGGSGGGNVGSTPVAGGAGIPGQGFAGGIGVYGCGTNYNAGGGGGGAGSTGTNATCYLRAGPGGIGRQSSIAGTPTYYAGGGGGGSGFSGSSPYRGLGGLGGGGAGTWYNNNTGCISQCGQPGTGGGGGGSGGYPSANYSGGQGGSGVVVISYPICSSANYLSIPSTTSNNLSNNNFTIEMWINTSASTRYSTLYAKEQGSFGTGQWQLMINSASTASGDVAFWAYDAPTGGSAPLLITTGTVINNSSWHHIALVRNGSAWNIYVDGGVKATATWSGTIADLTTSTVIGTDIVNTGRAYIGYITNLRMVNGTAVYIQNFTPSINPLTPVANTALLTLQNAAFVDNSGNNSTITNASAGITTIASVSPSLFSLDGYLTIINTLTPFSVVGPQPARLLEAPGFGIAQVNIANSTTNRKPQSYLLFNPATVSLTVNQYSPQTKYPPIVSEAPFNRKTYETYGFGVRAVNSNPLVTSYINYGAYFTGLQSTSSSAGYYYALVTGTPISTTQNTFSIESWMYLTGTTGTNSSYIVGDFVNTGTSNVNGWALGLNTTSNFIFTWNDGAVKSLATTAIASSGTWYHFAVSVNLNAISLYVNGVRQTSTTGTSILTNRLVTTNSLVIGSNGFNGYLSNLRIITNNILYSSNSFPVPTAQLGLVLGTQLLTLQNNYFIDNSPNRYTITPVGYLSYGAGTIFTQFKAAGGDIVSVTNSGIFSGVTSAVHIFTSTSTISYFTATTTITNVAFLIVGGGGQGGVGGSAYQRGGGGGGAGGMITGTFTATAGTTYGISVGRGGSYAPPLVSIPNSGFATAVYSVANDGSALFNGASNNYLSIPNSTAFQFGSGDFTVEAWVYRFGSNPFNQYQIIAGMNGTSPQYGWEIGISPTGIPVFVYSTNGSAANIPTFGAAITDNQWNHVAFTSYAGTLRAYLNGIQTGTNYTMLGAIYASTAPFWIGNNSDSSVFAQQTWNGYISNLRVTKGTALYTGTNFALSTTTPLTTVTNTVLLTLQTSTGFVDVSTSGFVVSTFNSDFSFNNTVYPTGFSAFSSTKLVAQGGGAGGAYHQPSVAPGLLPGARGGSGGGGSGGGTIGSAPLAGGASGQPTANIGVTGASSLFQYGFAGGTGTFGCGTNYNAGGGGGGAGSVGNNAPSYAQGGPGGIGRLSNITGVNQYYAGGGGGGNGYFSNPAGAGGCGGGGAGGNYTSNNQTAGTPGTGGGGGGAGGYPGAYYQGANGGSGVVVLSYSISCGSGNYLSVASTTSNNLSNNNFTIEMWVNTTATNRYTTLYSKDTGTFGTGQWQLMINSASTASGDVAFWAYDAPTGGSAPLLMTTGTTVNNGWWHHIALVRNGSAWNIYIDGRSSTATTWAGTIADLTLGTAIGTDLSVTGRGYTGYLTNLRMVNGTAVYTQNFVPTTIPLSNTASTALLTLQNTNFVDNSSNSLAITTIGVGITTVATLPGLSTATYVAPFLPVVPIVVVNTFTPFTAVSAQPRSLLEPNGFGLAGISVVNSNTNRKPQNYVLNPFLNQLITVNSYSKTNSKANQIGPNVTETLFNRVTYTAYKFGTVSYYRSNPAGSNSILRLPNNSVGLHGTIVVSTSTRARFNYNLPVNATAAPPVFFTTGTAAPQAQLTVNVNYTNTNFFSKSVNVGNSTQAVTPRSIYHVKVVSVVTRRLNDFGAKTMYTAPSKPIKTVAGPVNTILHSRLPSVSSVIARRSSDLGPKTLNIQTPRPLRTFVGPIPTTNHYRLPYAFPVIVRRLSDLGPKTLNIQTNGTSVRVRSTITNVINHYRLPVGIPIIVRRLSDLGPKTLNTQLNGIKIGGSSVPLYTIAISGTYNIIAIPNSAVIGYWS